MFKVLAEGCEPTRGSKYSACVDLYASEDVTIGAGETAMVGLGVCVNLEQLRESREFQLVNDFHFDISYWRHFVNSHYLQLMLRSSLGKKGLIIPNGVGVIDLDYKDEIKVLIHKPFTLYDIYAYASLFIKKFVPVSLSKEAPANPTRYTIKKSDKIAQITLLEHKAYLFGIETEEERKGGFGSTGNA